MEKKKKNTFAPPHHTPAAPQQHRDAVVDPLCCSLPSPLVYFRPIAFARACARSHCTARRAIVVVRCRCFSTLYMHTTCPLHTRRGYSCRPWALFLLYTSRAADGARRRRRREAAAAFPSFAPAITQLLELIKMCKTGLD
jgi:hypothetical protein